MTADELKTFVGQEVLIYRSGAFEGQGELISVNPGTFSVLNDNGEPVEQHVDDYSLTYDDTRSGELTIARRASNEWNLEPVTA